MTEIKHFFGMIKPTRDDFLTNFTSNDEKIMSEHFEYLKDLLRKSKLVVAGPVLNEKEPFGILIFECQTLEEAEKLFKDDPSVKAGIQQIKLLEPFRLSLYR
ncbi:MAG TPA: YciI family protein [Candidatus Bathyarchaeia archaeon]|nr:YciI family protein [Candidatus Bathyarchaeia archaeon]